MKIDKSVMSRMEAFSKRVGDMRQALSAAHTQLQTVAMHKDYKHVGVFVGDLDGDTFKVNFVGVALTVRFLAEMSDVGVALGKLNFYEMPQQVFEAERLIGSIKVKPNGITDLVDQDGDEVELAYYLIEAVLQMCEIVLKKRSDKKVQVGGLSI
jgi:hypothetical protein